MKIPLTENQFWIVFVIVLSLIGYLLSLNDPCKGLTGDAEWKCDYEQARQEYWNGR